MVVLSSLRAGLRIQPSTIRNAVINRPMSDHRTFPLAPSRWQWNKFKDHVHFYVMLGAIPCTLGIFCANIFVGPACLSETPAGYVPKYWEYYKSPITRFIARYILNDPQQDYEKLLAHLFMEHETARIRKLESEIKEKMGERHDYQAYYYKPVMAKYHRMTRETADYLETIRGE